MSTNGCCGRVHCNRRFSVRSGMHERFVGILSHSSTDELVVLRREYNVGFRHVAIFLRDGAPRWVKQVVSTVSDRCEFSCAVSHVVDDVAQIAKAMEHVEVDFKLGVVRVDLDRGERHTERTMEHAVRNGVVKLFRISHGKRPERLRITNLDAVDDDAN